MSTYQIKSGDTLSKIAAANGTTVAALMSANPNITNANKIQSGASLTIPGASSTVLPVNVTPSTSVQSATNSQGQVWSDIQGKYVTPQTASSNAGNGGTGSNTSTSNSTPIIDTSSITPTGNPNLDAATTGLVDYINSSGAQFQIPANLQITPALTAQFLNWAHSVVDPQTQQLLQNEATSINTSLQNAETQYNNQVGQTTQDYGTTLAAQDNAAGGNGVAFSGARGLADQNLMNTTNRSLASLGSSTAANIGNTLQTGAAQVGSANAGLFTTPSLSGASVDLSNNTGIGTTNNTTGGLNYNYNPSAYTMGAIPTSQNTALGNQQSNYMNQYTTLAANNTTGGRTMGDLLGMISGAPAGASTNLT